jgi:gas vesicle protein
MNSSKVLLGVLGGVAVGAIAGILFAPDKGSNTRKKLVDSGKDYVDNFKDKFDNLSQQVIDKYENFVAEATEVVEKHDVK